MLIDLVIDCVCEIICLGDCGLRLCQIDTYCAHILLEKATSKKTKDPVLGVWRPSFLFYILQRLNPHLVSSLKAFSDLHRLLDLSVEMVDSRY